jgi:U2 small nuclear ribonucleoprotein A'
MCHAIRANSMMVQDQFDTLDLSDNEVRRLEGFPLLKRLKTVIMNNNRVT